MNNKSGFYKIATIEPCKSLEHNPPSHIVVPYGFVYRHVCPICGFSSIIQSSMREYLYDQGV